MLCLANLRYGTGLRETAEMASSILIDFGVVTENDSTMVIDHNKVTRAQAEVMEWGHNLKMMS